MMQDANLQIVLRPQGSAQQLLTVGVVAVWGVGFELVHKCELYILEVIIYIVKCI